MSEKYYVKQEILKILEISKKKLENMIKNNKINQYKKKDIKNKKITVFKKREIDNIKKDLTELGLDDYDSDLSI